MRSTTKLRMKQAITAIALFCMTTQTTFAALLNFAQAPLFIGSNIPPKVMLAISKDQQLFKKAYNDYSDLDGDGTIETTYKHSIRYYGYFDYAKCYVYNAGNGRFEPQSVQMGPAPDPDAPSIPVPASCTGQWSGNFLNWISMTRMDAVRKLLYGGLRYPRSGESAAETVLERAFVPTDAHAWAKYYNPGPTGTPDQPAIEKLTPFAAGTIPTTTSSIRATMQRIDFVAGLPSVSTLNSTALSGDYYLLLSTPINGRVGVGDQVCFQRDGAGTAGVCDIRNPARGDDFFIGAIVDIPDFSRFGLPLNRVVRVRVNRAGVVGGSAATDWVVTNFSNTGISFCNLTTGSSSGGAQSRSSTNTNPPIIRVAKGNYGLWNANERWQCQWFEERNNLQAGFGGVRSNGNQASLSEIYASAESPSQTGHGLGRGSATGEYIVRVQVCVQNTALHGSEKCKQYPNGVDGAGRPYYKPIGVLQQYGDDQRIHFGLMTGSFQKNISGGVLRKNIGTFTDEIRANTNGTINTAVSGIVATLNNLKIYGYNYIDGTYLGGGGDNCTFQQNTITEGTCTSWGNPMSEVFYETLRYFAGKKGNASYQYTVSGSKDAELGLPVVPAASWIDPITPTLYCAKMNVLMFNSSVSTHDDDLRTTTASDINSSSTIGDLTSKLGLLEGIKAGDASDKPYFIGKVNGQTAGPNEFELCTPKAIPALGDASGICPEGPTVSGSYLMAGAAWHAHVNRIRTDVTPGASQPNALKVNSYAVQLATNTPQLNIPVPGGDKRIMIQPIYRLDLGGSNVGGGALVDLKIVRQDVANGTGKAYITWEDSEQGGDYDQDMWGTLEWKIDPRAGTITVTTNAVSASTINAQGFGYTINGTSQDGAHFHSGIIGFNYTDTTGVLGCTNCQVASIAGAGIQSGPTSVTYTIDVSRAGTLKDPMWYAAKYGGFADSDSDGVPNTRLEWDAIHNITGSTDPTDGEPDNYFLVTNPLQLEESIKRLFQDLTGKASASSVASNSTSLKTTTAIYNARFDAKDWSGDVRAFPINLDGSIAVTPAWEASQQLPAARARTMLTYNPVSRRGVPFRWPSGPAGANDIPSTVINNLNTNPDSGAGDGKGSQRLDWLRGDQTREGVASGLFRPRLQSRLGDVVNSNPVFVDSVPNDVNLDASYRDFRTPYLTSPRAPMIYVGANDGAVHGYDASVTGGSGGVEKLAYIPSKAATRLNALTSQAYTHRPYVDASPVAADVQRDVGGPWSTVLVGGLGAGGQGIYALDITDPSRFNEGNTATVLWEFNDTDDRPGAGLSNHGLGYVFGQPVIRKMANGRWAAIVSGGYNNSEGDGAAGDGRAYLYIIFLKGPTGGASGWIHGTDYIRIDSGAGTAATPNGLAPPFAADVDADGRVDYIYNGDLLGNFWKFDVSSPDTRNWTSPSSRVRMFIARSAGGQVQPITSRAEGTPHPSGNGFVLTFGTGKYLEPSDPIGPYRNETFYGVWDKNDGRGNVASQTTRDITRSRLFEQVIVVDGMFRSIKSRTAISSSDPNAPRTPDWSTHWGWYMDFPSGTTTGERSVFTPLLLAGRLIFTTLIPSGGACDFGGTSFLMVISPSTGAGAEGAVLDVNGDRVLNTLDQLRPGVYASGVQSAVGITPTPTVIAGRSIAGAAQNQGSTILGTTGPLLQGFGSLLGYMIIAGSSGNMNSSLVGLSNNSGRVSWREVVKD